MPFEFTENITLYFPEVENQLADIFSEKDSATSSHKLIKEIAAIHEGLTANYNMYPAAELEASLSTWVQPYPKPIITNHDMTSDPVGRVMAAKMDKESDGTPYIRLQVAVSNPGAVERIADERYLTGSVGGRADHANCSICGKDWSEASQFNLPCKHQRGKVYNGKLAFLELSGLSWKEYSFVNIPADQKSGFRDPVTAGVESIINDGWITPVKFYSMDMNNESIVELSESEKPHEILNDMKKKDAHFMYMNLKGTFLAVSAYDYKENVDEKINFNQTITTIDNEHDKETHVHSDQSVATEEKEKMTVSTEEATEDILEVAEKLSADLAGVTEVTEDEKADETEVETNSEESSDDSDKETDTETSTEESEAEAENKESETDESLVDETSTTDASEQTELTDTETASVEEETKEEENEEETKVDPTVVELQTQLEALQTENVKLRKSLHFMLAERVVDAKITLGIIESDERADALTEHSTRTASSLADAIRDLEKYPVNKTISNEGMPGLNVRSVATKDERSSIVEETEEVQEAPVDERALFEKTFVDVFMNRSHL